MGQAFINQKPVTITEKDAVYTISGPAAPELYALLKDARTKPSDMKDESFTIARSSLQNCDGTTKLYLRILDDRLNAAAGQ